MIKGEVYQGRCVVSGQLRKGQKLGINEGLKGGEAKGRSCFNGFLSVRDDKGKMQRRGRRELVM